ncbi:hypothetical protein N9K75_00660 [bacterium]|nr:hypothetical protein [bacterium]
MFQTISNRLTSKKPFFYIGSGLGVLFSSTLLYYSYPHILNTIHSTRLYKYVKDDSKEEKENENKAQEEPYENKYYDRFEQLECEDLEEDTVKGMKNNTLYEMTPKGKVIMYYDFEKESFVYYCDTKDIPYLYLETVARKYALTYDCKKIVVDIKKEMENAKQSNTNKSKLSTIYENTSSSSTKKTTDMFASFKSYNRKGTGGSKATNKKFVLRQNANRYSYSGKVSQYPILKTDDYKIEKPMEKMDYETFKKLMAKKN